MTLGCTLGTLESIWGAPFCKSGIEGTVRPTGLWNLWSHSLELALSLVRKPSRDVTLHTN